MDTRTAEEFTHGHIDGFLNIPVDELRERLDELDKHKPVYVICQSGLRSYIACRILAGNGFDCITSPAASGSMMLYSMIAASLNPPPPAVWTNNNNPFSDSTGNEKGLSFSK